jgi:L-ribulose-5-phosphate 3-epimerase
MKRDSLWPVGVCTWSLGNDVDKIDAVMQQAEIGHVHLALGPAFADGGRKYLDAIAKQGWKISATMAAFPQEDYSSLDSIRRTGGIVPDECWDHNRKIVFDAIDLASQLGVKYLEFHFGFLDMSERTYARKLLDRAKLLADAAGQKNVTILMETGQETASTLRQFLEALSHPSLAVNFDPANMILYGKGKPVEAVEMLSPWIRHVHAKDARAAPVPGTWGTEVAWGDGEVNAKAFLGALKKAGYNGVLSVEREAGDSRQKDIVSAVERIRAFE